MNETSRLDIVFALETELEEPIGVGPNVIGRCVIKGGLSACRVFQVIVEVLTDLGLSTSFSSRRDGRHFSAETMLRRLKEGGSWGGIVENGNMSFLYSEFPANGYSFLSIVEIVPGGAVDWNRWVDPFAREKWFSQAWLADVSYDYWQNAKHPFQYENAGRSCDGLPMRSNGLPPPVEQVEIDISRNPGRRIVRARYVEAIGATMWLGEPFWNTVGLGRKRLIMSSKLLTCSSLGNGVLRISAGMELFNDSSSVTLQDELRELLYGTTAKGTSA